VSRRPASNTLVSLSSQVLAVPPSLQPRRKA
jgi:hypothetical protein